MDGVDSVFWVSSLVSYSNGGDFMARQSSFGVVGLVGYWLLGLFVNVTSVYLARSFFGGSDRNHSYSDGRLDAVKRIDNRIGRVPACVGIVLWT